MTHYLATSDGIAALPGGDPQSPPVGVLRGDDVALHRVMLMETSLKRRREEALMRATDLAAQPMDELHVAVAPANDADGGAWIAVIDRTRMAEHVERFRAAGMDVAALVPAPLLLGEDGAAMADLDGMRLVRTAEFAATVEPELAATLAPDAIETPFAPVAGGAPLNLLQGDFAPRVRWWRLRWVQVGAALLLLLSLLFAALPAIVQHRRAAAMEAASDAQAMELARRVTGSPAPDAASAAQALARARQKADGSAVAPRLTLVASVVGAVPAARVEGLRLGEDGTLFVRLGGPAAAVEQAKAGFRASPAFVTRTEGTEVAIGRRTPLTPEADAAIAIAARGAETVPAIPAALEAAGLADIATVTSDGSASVIDIPAVSSTTLLPLIARLEASGYRIGELTIDAGRPPSLSAHLKLSK